MGCPVLCIAVIPITALPHFLGYTRKMGLYCMVLLSPEGMDGHYGGPSEPLQQGETTPPALSAFTSPPIFLQRLLIYLSDSTLELRHHLQDGGDRFGA